MTPVVTNNQKPWTSMKKLAYVATVCSYSIRPLQSRVSCSTPNGTSRERTIVLLLDPIEHRNWFDPVEREKVPAAISCKLSLREAGEMLPKRRSKTKPIVVGERPMSSLSEGKDRVNTCQKGLPNT